MSALALSRMAMRIHLETFGHSGRVLRRIKQWPDLISGRESAFTEVGLSSAAHGSVRRAAVTSAMPHCIPGRTRSEVHLPS